MEIGFVCKIVIWLLVGCRLYKKFKKIKSLNKPTLIIDCGLPLCLAKHSLFLCCNPALR